MQGGSSTSSPVNYNLTIMQLKFDWLIVLENLRRGIMVTDATLEGPRAPALFT